MRSFFLLLGILIGLLFGRELIKPDVIGDYYKFKLLMEEDRKYKRVYGSVKVKKGCDIQRGYASWYGPRFHGRRTANGEIYNMFMLTAASRELPLGSYVLVISPDTGRKVVVRINDRGPYVDGRIIDLSYAAARKLGLLRRGVGEVIVIPLECLSYETQRKLYDQVIADIIRTF
ncbi:septal ring lytic transglycosylase RlpA family protein [Aquifex sp.]